VKDITGGPVPRREVRHFRFQLVGQMDIFTDEKASEAADQAHALVEKASKQYGISLGVGPMTILQGFE
jgi:hypothetical protein